MQPGPLLSKSVKDVVSMNNSQRFYLAILVITIVSVLIASGNIAGAKELVLLVPTIVAALWPWERFRSRHPDETTEKRMTSPSPTRHSNR